MEYEKEAPSLPPGLKEKIMVRVVRESRRRMVMKAAGFAAVLSGSLALAAFGWSETVREASSTGFFAFASLLISDFSLAIGNFSDFVLSMAGSFPVFPAVLLLSGAFFAVWSAARFFAEVSVLRGSRHASVSRTA